MTGFVASHLVNGVVDCVKTRFLCTLCKVELAGGSSALSVNAHLKILLGGVGYNFAEELRKLSGMLSLFKSSLLPLETDLGITLAVSDASHCKIHTDLAALALEVSAQILDDVLAYALCNADNMLGSPALLALLSLELLSGSLADGAGLGSRIALMDIAANRTNKFHFQIPSF